MVSRNMHIRPAIALNAIVLMVVTIASVFVGSPRAQSKGWGSVATRRDSITPAYSEYYRKGLRQYIQDTIAPRGFGGKSFCYYEDAGNRESGSDITQYLYMFCQEYFIEDTKLHIGTGIAGPVIINIRNTSEDVQAIGFIQPNINDPKISEIIPDPFLSKLQTLGDLSRFPVWPNFEPAAKKYFNVETTIYD